MEYLVFEGKFIALVKFVGTFEELEKQGYKRPVMAFYTDETKLYEIIEIWHLDLTNSPIFYEEYKVGYITHFSDKNRINLSKMTTDRKKKIIDELFRWSEYNII